MWAYDKSFTDQDCQYWLDWNMNSYRSDGFGLWKIIHKETSEVVGECGITMQTVEGENYPEIGYHLKKSIGIKELRQKLLGQYEIMLSKS
ncbi:hypothetical protein CUGBS08_01738 [Streptococcus agalactiae]|nr:hypothetical protein CUGBS08_01738 [Streptococcus agalactiae]AMQ17278.1 hypothetical protein CUGBS98_01674 [Streptococcus agalactiae]